MKNRTFYKLEPAMDLFDALSNRRSIRKYTDTLVENKLLERIISYGMYAPSAVNKQPWHFIIFRNKKTIEQIVKVHPNAQMLKAASAGILICFDKTLEHDEDYGPVDCSAAAQNILLAAHGFGLGACWIGVYPREKRIKELCTVFELPEHVVPFAVISLGYSNEEKLKPERFKKDRVNYEKWE